MTATNLTQNFTQNLTKNFAPARPSLSRRGFLGGLASGAAALALALAGVKARPRDLAAG